MYPLDLLESPSHNPNPKRSNEALYYEIFHLHNEKDAVKNLIDLLAPFEFPSSHLRPSNLEELRGALDKEKAEDFQTSPAYNGRAYIEFHCLIIALCISCIQALKECFDVHQAAKDKDEDEDKDRKRDNLKAMDKATQGVKVANKRESVLQDIQLRVWKHTRILWTVTSSRIFDDYLHALQGTLMSVYPGQISAYTKYFESLGLEDEKSDGLDGMVAVQHEGDNFDEGEGSKEDVAEDQMRELNLQTSDANSVTRFKSWMCTITSDFQALRNVVKAAIKCRHPIVSHFIEAKHFSIPDGEVRNQVTTTSSGPVSPEVTANISSPYPTITLYQAKTAINLLQQRIDQDRKTLNMFGASSGTSDSPSSSDNTSASPLETGDEKTIEAGMVVWTGQEHPEGIAGAVFRHPDRAIQQDQTDMRKLISLCNAQEISVSRLCCPTCWELLQVQGFKMRGFHTSFYPVELPFCLTEPELKEMITRFRRHLCRELITFMEEESTKVLHSPSESHSNHFTLYRNL